MSSQIITRKNYMIQDPPIARFLFSDTRLSIVWLFVRIWLGLQWWQSGFGKIQDPKWVQTGESLKAYWERAVAIPAPPARPAISFDWYRSFLQFLLDTQSYGWFAKFVAYGEVLVAIGLFVGAFVGIAAFFGAVMNWNFIMAGSASSNGFLLLVALLLVLAWKTAGYIGLDYFLLRWVGTPWKGLALDHQPQVQRVGSPAR